MKKISPEIITGSRLWKPSLHQGFSVKSNSWFTITSKHAIKMPYQHINSETNFIRCKQVKLNPTLKQRNLLIAWLEAYRITYNITVKYLKKHCNITFSKYNLRSIIKQEIANNAYLKTLFKTIKVPVHTLDNAIFDVIKARKVAFANLRLKNIKHFRMRYKKQSHHKKILVLEPTVFNIKGTGLKNKLLNNLRPSENIISDKDTRLQYNDRTKKFILFIPFNKKTTIKVNRHNACALDPGIRTFQTAYADGITYQFSDTNVIKNNINRIEKVKDLKDKKWYKTYVNRLREKLKNRISDLHWKTASFLCKNFDTILIGNMSTKGIVTKSLNSHTKRMAYALSHFLFKQRLASKADEYNCKFKIVDESYTSKTCGGCGKLHDKLGSSSIFECPHDHCYYRMNRDIHGARNIYIKNSNLL